jgi:glycosyltransferase involved in cell wall biosynthesis
MRILQLTPVPPDRRAAGAIPVLLHAALVGLAECHDVTVVTAAGPDPDELAAAARLGEEGFDVRVVPRHLGADRWRRRARMGGTWVRGREPWRTTWFHEPSVQGVLDDALAAEDFDVVAVEDNAMATYRFRTAAPLVLTEMEVRRPRRIDWHAGPPRRWARWAVGELDWARWPRYQRDVWSRFDAVQLYADRDVATAALVAPDLAGRFRSTPFGIELPDDAGHGDDAAAAATIGFLGNYTHPPNVDAAEWLARDIFPRVRRAVPDARLRIAGRMMPASLRALATPGVELVGEVADGDEFLRSSTVVAAPVRIGGGMRMKVLHAMALGKPVVTTTRGAEGLLSSGPLPIAVADDTDAVANATVRLLADADIRRELGRAARALVEREHSPRAFAARLTTVYEQVIEDRRREGRQR